MCGTAHARSHDDSRDRRRRRSVKSQGRQTTHPARWYSSRGGWGMKRVLVVYFSQTGQLRRVAESLCAPLPAAGVEVDWRSEEHTSELQSLMRLSYAVLCLKKK